jgi:hypothetical protein
MNDEELLARLGKLAKSQDDAEDAQWETLARGELDPKALAELEARAADDPEVALRLQLFRPLEEATKHRIADALAQDSATGDSDAGDAPENAATRAAVPAGVRRLAPNARWAVVAVPLALAAALALFLLRPQSLSPLPDYSASLRGGQAELRSGDASDAVPRIGPGSEFDLQLRPSVDVDGAVEARAFVVQAGRVTPVAASPRIAPSGGFRLQGRGATWFGAARGKAEMVILVGRQGTLQEIPQSVVRGEQAAPEIQRVVVAVELVDD